MKFIELPVRNLGRYRVRSVLTALGIAIALGGMVALVGLSRGMERSVTVSFEEKGTHIIALQKGTIDLLAATLDEDQAAMIRAIPGVVSVMPGLAELVDFETGQMAYVAGRPLDGDFWTSLRMIQGVAPSQEKPEGVVLGEALSQMLSKRPGDTIELSGREFTITGIAKQESALDDRSVIMPLKQLQKLLGIDGKVSGFHIKVAQAEDPAAVSAVQARLAAAFPTLSFTQPEDMGRDVQIFRLMRALAWSSSTIALGMALIAVLNTLLMSVIERSREIGLLSAIGWHPVRVMAMVMLDGVVLASSGAVLGVGMGLLCLRWIIHHPKLGGLLQPDVTASLLLEGVVLALLMGVLGGLYPAWRAVRLDPMTLLRSE